MIRTWPGVADTTGWMVIAFIISVAGTLGDLIPGYVSWAVSET